MHLYRFIKKLTEPKSRKGLNANKANREGHEGKDIENRN